MKAAVIINGLPRSGKDTFAGLVAHRLLTRGHRGANVSSIDPVRMMLSNYGISTSAKTPEDRALLAEVGAAIEKHSGARTQYCFDAVMRNNAVTFVHMREHDLIEKLRARLIDMRVPVYRLLMVSDRAETDASNDPDRFAERGFYDCVVHNDGTIRDLDILAELFARDVIEDDVGSRYQLHKSEQAA